MANNTAQGGTDTLRTIDRAGVKVGVSVLDVGGTASEALAGDAGVGLAVKGLGTAGTANSAVLTVQGIASMTPVAVSDNSSSLTVDYATTGSGTATGALRVELPTNGTGVIAAVTAITNALPAGTNALGSMNNSPTTVGGWDLFMASSGDGSTALTNTAQAVKASAGKLGGWYIYNPNAAATYVILYNTAQGSVTVGTTNPLMVLCIPAASAANLEVTNGIAFSTAISVAATTTGGGNTAPSTALEANFWYK